MATFALTPDAITFDQARGYTLGAGIVFVVLGVLALLLLRRLLVKLVVVVVAVVLAVVFFGARSRISIDRQTCSAKVFGITVSVPPQRCHLPTP